jgi:hypothetical protein
MKVKYQSHQAGHSPEFLAGAPGPWPRIEEQVDDAAVLTPSEVSQGFQFLTLPDWVAIRTAHAAAWSTYETQQTTAANAALAARRTEVLAAFVQLVSVADPNNHLTNSEIRIAVKLMARLLLHLEEPLTKA